MRISSICIYDDVRIYCHLIDKIQEEYKRGTGEDEEKFLQIAEKIKKLAEGRNTIA
jgi:hypothetical protein